MPSLPATEPGGIGLFYSASPAMKMNWTVRRLASFSALILTLGICSASQAGVIPWVYDTIFGPVRYTGYGYVPYSVSYGPRPVNYASSSGAGCSSCSTSYYAPAYYAQNSGCGCGPIAWAQSCEPCGNACSTSNSCLSGCSPSSSATTTAPQKTPAKSGFVPSKPNAPQPKEGPTAKKPAPTQTFESPEVKSPSTTDGLGAGGRSRGVRVDSDVNEASGTTESFKPVAPTETPESTIPTKKKAPEVNPIDEFEKPIESNKDSSATEDQGTETTIQRRARPSLNLDDKIAGQAEPFRSRILLHAKVVSAQVARRTTTIETDWTVVPSKPTTTQLVRK